MANLTQRESVGVLRVALAYYLVKALTSDVKSSDVIDNNGATLKFEFLTLGKVIHVYFTHDEIAPVYVEDEYFDVICLKVKGVILNDFPEVNVQEVIRFFSLVE